MSKLITVFGATGTQGGSVIRTIIADPELSKEFRIRAVTRDLSKPKAKALAEQGIEVIQVRKMSIQHISQHNSLTIKLHREICHPLSTSQKQLTELTPST